MITFILIKQKWKKEEGIFRSKVSSKKKKNLGQKSSTKKGIMRCLFLTGWATNSFWERMANESRLPTSQTEDPTKKGKEKMSRNRILCH